MSNIARVDLMILLVHHACTSFIVYMYTMKDTPTVRNLTLLCDMGVLVTVFVFTMHLLPACSYPVCVGNL